jgi:hypothetical protein
MVTVTLAVADRARLEPALTGLADILAAWCQDRRALDTQQATGLDAVAPAPVSRAEEPCRYPLSVRSARRQAAADRDPAAFILTLPPPELLPANDDARRLLARHFARQVILQQSTGRRSDYGFSVVTIDAILREELLNQWLARLAPSAAMPEKTGERLYADLAPLFPGTAAVTAAEAASIARSAQLLAADAAPQLSRSQLTTMITSWHKSDTAADWLIGSGLDLASADALLARWAGAPAPFPAAQPLLIVSRQSSDRWWRYLLALPGHRLAPDIARAACDRSTALAAAWYPGRPELAIVCPIRAGGPGQNAIVRLAVLPDGNLQRLGEAVRVGPMPEPVSELATSATGAVAWWDDRGRLASWSGQPGAPVRHVETDFSAAQPAGRPSLAFGPVWSPNGDLLAYQSSMDPSRWAVLSPDDAAPRWQAEAATAVWSPDSAQLVLRTGSAGAFTLTVVDSLSGRARQRVRLPDWPPPASPIAAESPEATIAVWLGDWSPDGHWLGLLYQAWVKNPSNKQVGAAMAAWNATTGQVRLLPLSLPAYRLRWQPDGKRLSTVEWSERPGNDAAKAVVWNVTTDQLDELLPTALNTSPDGLWVASDPPNALHVYRTGATTPAWSSGLTSSTVTDIRWQK